MRLALLVSLFVAVAPGSVQAGPFCDEFQEAPTEKQGAYLLLIVDQMLTNWPQHRQFTSITSDAERLAMFAGARKKIVSACSSGKDFAAGVALGEDLAIYKMTLLQAAESLKNVPQE